MSVINEIELDKLYTPREVAESGYILNSKGKEDYYFVLKLIKRKVLKARDYTFGKSNPNYQILGRDILEYKKDYEGVPVEEVRNEKALEENE